MHGRKNKPHSDPRIAIFGFCALLLFSFTTALAADTAAPADGSTPSVAEKPLNRFAISLDPLLVVLGVVHVSVQAALSDIFVIPVFFTHCKLIDDITMNGVSLGLRLYPGEEAHKGFYIGPFLNYTGMSKGAESHSLLGFGVELGAMIEVGRRFFLDLGAGLIRYDVSGIIEDFDIPVVLPIFNMAFGVKF